MKSKVNLTIEKSVSAEARELGVNMSRVAEDAIAKAVKHERNCRWMEENRAALDRYAREIEEEGLPLKGFRTF